MVNQMPVSSADIAASNARDAQDKTMVLAEAVVWVLENWDEGPAAKGNAMLLRKRLLNVFYQLKWDKIDAAKNRHNQPGGE